MTRPFLVSALLLLSAPPALRSAEVAVELSQTATNGKVNLRLTNNDPGAVYNSATLDLGAMLRPVIDAVVAQHPAFSSEAEVWAYIRDVAGGGVITPSGEVYFGWDASLDPATGLLAISNNGLIPEVTYTVWQNTTSNGSQDEMVVTVNLGSLLDLDGSGGLEEGEEAVVLPALSDPAPVPPAGVFAGTVNAIESYSIPVPRVVVRGPWRERGAESAWLEAQVGSGGDLVLTWRALHGLSYTVETATTLSSDPLDWTELATYQRPATPGAEWQAMTHTATAAVVPSTVPARRFYRLRVEMP